MFAPGQLPREQAAAARGARAGRGGAARAASQAPGRAPHLVKAFFLALYQFL